jgi:outer membrane protein assembly factor BamB
VKLRFFVTVFVFLLSFSSVMAQEVIGWRSDPTGRFLDAEPVIEWSAEENPGKNIVWKTAMPNWSNASPIIVGDRIFACAEPATLICVRASDGEILWERTNTYLDAVPPEELDEVKRQLDEVQIEETTKEFRSTENKLNNEKNKLKKLPEDAEPEKRAELEKSVEELSKKHEELKAKLKPVWEYVMPKTHDVNGYSSPTPASDGKYVYVLYGTGVATCYDMDGNRKWIRMIEKPTHDYGHSASPIVAGDKLIVHMVNLYALDKETGETIWKSKAEPRWGTGIVVNIGGVDVIITPNADFFRLSDGKQLRAREGEDKGFLEYARPIVHDGVVYFIQHKGKAFKLPSEVGDTINPELLWETMPKDDRYYASSVYHDGLIYAIVRQGHEFSVIDAETGEVIYTEVLKLGKGDTFPSITLAGKHLFISNDNGTTVIMEPGREPKEIVRNSLETFRSSPVFVGKRMYIRGREHLYCIGQ